MLACLAFDPGPTRTGVAVVAFDGIRFELAYGGHVEFGGGVVCAGRCHPLRGEGEVRFLIDDAAQAGPVAPSRSEVAPPRLGAPALVPARAEGAFVAIEQLVGYAYEAKRVQALIETARIEGRLIELARRGRFEPELIPAKEWRGALCRCESASDEQIRIVVEGLLHGIPITIRATERPHIYDAAGLALVALARAAGVPLRLPATVEAALWQRQQAEKAERATKKAARAAGLPAALKGKRSATRMQRARRSDAAKRGWKKRR